MPPINEESKQRYDSIKGVTGNCEVFIVYDNGKSYPEYLITYSLTKSPLSSLHKSQSLFTSTSCSNSNIPKSSTVSSVSFMNTNKMKNQFSSRSNPFKRQ